MSHLDRERGVFIATFRGPTLEQELVNRGIYEGCQLRSIRRGIVAEFMQAYRVNGRTWLLGRIVDANRTGFIVGNRLALRAEHWEVVRADGG